MLTWTRANVLEVVRAEKVWAQVGLIEIEVMPVDHVEALVRKQADDAGERARSIIDALRRQAEVYAAQAETRARAAIAAEGGRHTRNWTAAVKAGTQIDVAKLLADDDLVQLLSVKSEEFVGLIKNLTEDMAYRINREVLGSILEGRSNADIAKALTNIEDIGRGRARLIARDQANKLNGAMNRFRQEQAGITHFKWKTIIDGRQRDSHGARDNKIYPWDAPPSGEIPGGPINCRCRALAVLIDTPEDAAEFGAEGDPEDPFDPSSEGLIDTVAGTMGENVFAMNREAALIRQAEARKARDIIEAARKAAEFTEADAEALFERVFGFSPEGQDLARMSGSNALITRYRSLLFAAIQQRISTIEELAEHAAATASN
jgi:SPP1 gp7 family putative phage head morphogenesis protein